MHQLANKLLSPVNKILIGGNMSRKELHLLYNALDIGQHKSVDAWQILRMWRCHRPSGWSSRWGWSKRGHCKDTKRVWCWKRQGFTWGIDKENWERMNKLICDWQHWTLNIRLDRQHMAPSLMRPPGHVWSLTFLFTKWLYKEILVQYRWMTIYDNSWTLWSSNKNIKLIWKSSNNFAALHHIIRTQNTLLDIH